MYQENGKPDFVKIELDFSCPEKTIAEFNRRAEDLGTKLYQLSSELGEAEVGLLNLEGNAAIAARNSREKCSDALTETLVNADDSVCDARKAVERLRAKVNAVRFNVEQFDKAGSKFKAWMDMQSRAGLRD